MLSDHVVKPWLSNPLSVGSPGRTSEAMRPKRKPPFSAASTTYHFLFAIAVSSDFGNLEKHGERASVSRNHEIHFKVAKVTLKCVRSTVRCTVKRNLRGSSWRADATRGQIVRSRTALHR